jgi:GxxExxY protein
MKGDDEVAAHIVDAAVAIHKALGPGLLESAYMAALQIEFDERGLNCKREVPIEAKYRGRPLGLVYRADLLVEGKVLVEVKAVLGPEPLHVAQLLSYLRLGGWRLGLLLNFNSPLMKDGIRRIVNTP